MSAPTSDNPHESTPLLPSDARSDHQTPNGSPATDSPVAEVDEEVLDLDLARVQSIPHGGEAEPGFRPVPSHDSNASENGKTSAGSSSHFINLSPAKFWTIFSGILFSYLIAFFDSTLMASIHPVVTSHFRASNSASWLSTAFLLTCTAFQPLFGRLSDTFGRRPIYLFSIAVFFVTTAWCAMAQSIGSFIAARAFCGLGAGAVNSLGLIMSSDLVRVEYRGIYQSYINLMYGIGGSLGIAMGGLIADHFGWRAAFGIQLPFIFLYLIVAYFTTPSSLGPELARTQGYTLRQAIKTIDLKGSFTLVAGVTTLILGINLGGNVLSWGHPVVISSLVASFIITLIFVKVETKAKRPVMPLALLSSSPRSNLILSNFFGNITINTVLFNAPLFFQAVKLESPTQSGLRLLASSFGLMISSVSTGFIITYTRRLKPTLAFGAVCFIIGSIATGNLAQSIPGWLAMAFLVPSSFGQGFTLPSTLISVLAISSQEEQAVTTTTLGLFRNLGAVMGVAISSWVLQNSLLMYLTQTVTGHDKLDIIRNVRQSISAIYELDPLRRGQGQYLPHHKFYWIRSPFSLLELETDETIAIVIDAYGKALRLTFLSSIVWSSIVFFLLAPIKLPRLGKKK